jgi:hypothetical protein
MSLKDGFRKLGIAHQHENRETPGLEDPGHL